MRKETGATVNERIVRARMQAAARLLQADPPAESSTIAGLVGFGEVRTLQRTFRTFFGSSLSTRRSWSYDDAGQETVQSIASAGKCGSKVRGAG